MFDMGQGWQERAKFLLTGRTWSIAFALLSALIVTGVVRWYYAGEGEFGDEGAICMIGQGMLDGALPYRDFFNEKPPLQFLWTAVVMFFAGEGMGGTRLAAEIALFLTLAIAFVGVAQHRKMLTLIPAAALWILLIVMTSAYRNTVDVSLALLFVASAFLLFKPDLPLAPSWRSALLGLFLGLACGFRVTAGLVLLILAVSPWLERSRKPFLLGAVVGLALWISWLALAGVLKDAIDSILLFHVGNGQAKTYHEGLNVHSRSAMVACALLLGAACLRFPNWKERGWFAALALAAAVTYFGRSDAFRLWPAMAMMMVVALSCSGPFLRERTIGLGLCVGVATMVALLAYDWPGKRSYDWVNQVVAQVRLHARSGESIWVAPFAPSVYCVADNPPASRYYFVLPWTAKPEVQQQIMDGLQASPPRIVVEINKGYALEDVMPRAKRWLVRSYVLANSINGANIWKLRDSPVRQAPGDLLRVRHQRLPEKAGGAQD